MTETNIFSPQEEYDDDDEIIYNRSVISFSRKVNHFININKNPNGILDYTKINVQNSRGEFSYRSIGKKQRYTMTIRSIEDAIFFCCLLEQRPAMNNVIPAQLRKTYNLFEFANLDNHSFTYTFKDKLLPWINPTTRGRGRNKVIQNPVSKRMIKIDKTAYKKTFKKIKLKKVIYEPLQNFNTIDYEIKDYCVPSYLEKFLLKKEYKVICDEINEIKTPTYEELTKIMNKIDYNLNVYTHDCDKEQEQKEYKKTLTIIVHDEHMYVTNNCHIIKNVEKIQYCQQSDFDKIKSERYTDSSKIHNNIKYKLINPYCDIDKLHQLRSTFSNVNIKFYNDCEIRPVRYYNENESCENAGALDINSCYPNILYNQNYVFPVQDGTEETKIYMKTDIIERHGFYYVTFKKMNEIQKALFYESCWIMGALIIDMKLQNLVEIKFKHVSKSAQSAQTKPIEFDKIKMTCYSGYLAKYKTEKEYIYECCGEEADAYLEKYKDKSCFYTSGKLSTNDDDDDIEFNSIIEREELLKKYPDATYTNPNVKIVKEYYLKSSGIYAYLAILQYARLQLYHIYNEVIKSYPNIKIKKIYTDSIAFNEKINDITKINKNLNKFGFNVKHEKSNYSFTPSEISVKEPKIKTHIMNEHTDIEKLLKSSVSFSVNARAGYGKTYMIKNNLIPYLNMNHKKFILSSTTNESSNNLINDGLDCEVINTTLLSKSSDLETLKRRFNDIDYLIVDESSRLSMNLYKLLEYIRDETNVKLILFGDKNQCDYDNSNLMESDVFNRLIDYNNLTIKWHSKARYTKEYDEFLNKILSYEKGGYDKDCINYVKSFFGKQIKNKKNSIDNNKIKLTYTNFTRKQFENSEGMTTHKAQGKTIDEHYSIYEIERMSKKVLYTALSRCTNHKLINIYL